MEFRSTFSILATLPPIALIFTVIQITLYLVGSYCMLDEENVWVSWVKVVDEWQIWRLIVAHYFHFTRIHLFWTVVTLMTVGRCLENKLTKTAMVLIIILNGIVSNTIFLFLNLILCPPEKGLKLSDTSHGFTNLTLGLRVILAYIQEPRNYEASVLYGLFPVVLPASWAPWQPCLEIIIFKISLMEMCVAYPIASTLSGFILSHAAKRLFPHEWIFLPETETNENDSDQYRNRGDASDCLSPGLSVEVLRAIQSQQANINFHTNQNGIIRYSFEEDAPLNRSSLRFQIMLHQQLQQQALRLGGSRKRSILKLKNEL